MDDAIRRLRLQARQLARSDRPTGVRYPAGWRRAAMAVARRRLEAGERLSAVARALGVSRPSLTRWLQAPDARDVLRPVVVAAAPAPTPATRPDLVLITPQGVRVEGLDREELIAVLRALG